MSGVRIDRGNKGKINSVSGVPSSNVKGNICIDSTTGWIYTRKTPAASWDLAGGGTLPWSRYYDFLYPSFIPSSGAHTIVNPSGSMLALSWNEDRVTFGNDTIVYVAGAEELKIRLQSSSTEIIVLGDRKYEMPAGTITIGTSKTIIGSAGGESIIEFRDDTSADYLHIDNTEDVVFKDLTITKAADVGAAVPFLIRVEDSDKCRFENCTFGDATSTTGTSSYGTVLFDNSDNCIVENCKFIMDVEELDPPVLILANDSSNLIISDNWGSDLHSSGSIWIDSCPGATITSNKFVSHSTELGSVSMLIENDSSITHVENNVLANINLGSVLNSPAIFSAVTLGGPSPLDGLTVTNNTFILQQAGDDVGAYGEPVITLTGKNVNFTKNNVRVDYHGYNDDTAVDLIPTNVVLYAQGEHLLISENSFDVENCRCAIYLDSTAVDGVSSSYGNRITGNNISGFSIASVGAAPSGLRIDGTGIYLGAASGGLITHQGTVISNNISKGGLNSTAIRGCPINCVPGSYPPSPGETAEALSIVGNIMHTNTVSCFGISMATISYSSIIGNTFDEWTVSSVIDNSEAVANNTNEYGTAGAVEPGVNL